MISRILPFSFYRQPTTGTPHVSRAYRVPLVSFETGSRFKKPIASVAMNWRRSLPTITSFAFAQVTSFVTGVRAFTGYQIAAIFAHQSVQIDQIVHQEIGSGPIHYVNSFRGVGGGGGGG